MPEMSPRLRRPPNPSFDGYDKPTLDEAWGQYKAEIDFLRNIQHGWRVAANSGELLHEIREDLTWAAHGLDDVIADLQHSVGRIDDAYLSLSEKEREG